MIAALAHAWTVACQKRGVAPPRQVHVLKLGGVAYPHPASPLVFLLFDARASQPGAVAKVARVAEGDAAIETEAGWLSALPQRLPPAVAAAIPELYDAGRIDGRAYWLASAIPGRVELHHTWGAAGARRAAARIEAALDWCRQLAEATPAPAIATAEWLGPFPDVVSTLDAQGLAPEIMARIAPRLQRMWPATWPAALAHGDFFPGNVLFAPGPRIGVVDWSAAVERAPLCIDPLAYEFAFALHALAVADRIDERAHRAVHALAPIAAARQRLATAGIDVGLGADARLLTCVAGILREARAATDRATAARRWLRLLEFESGITAE